MNDSVKQPPKAEQNKLVTLYCRKVFLLDDAPIMRQQQADVAFRKHLTRMADKYPHIDLSSDEFFRNLYAAAKREADKKVFRGAGSTF